jgi:hypothetical protein
MKKIEKNRADKEDEDTDEIRSFPLYGMLCCGIVIFAIGLYMYFSTMSTSGYAAPESGSGHNIRMTGCNCTGIAYLYNACL